MATARTRRVLISDINNPPDFICDRHNLARVMRPQWHAEDEERFLSVRWLSSKAGFPPRHPERRIPPKAADERRKGPCPRRSSRPRGLNHGCQGFSAPPAESPNA
jgi:hypothetical protein